MFIKLTIKQYRLKKARLQAEIHFTKLNKVYEDARDKHFHLCLIC